jgi:hypothetical protein
VSTARERSCTLSGESSDVGTAMQNLDRIPLNSLTWIKIQAFSVQVQEKQPVSSVGTKSSSLRKPRNVPPVGDYISNLCDSGHENNLSLLFDSVLSLNL